MVPVMNSHCCRCHPLMMDCEGPRARGAAACRAAPSPRSEGGRAGRQQAGRWSPPGPVLREEQAAGQGGKEPPVPAPRPLPPTLPQRHPGQGEDKPRWKHPEPHRPPVWPRKASRAERTAQHWWGARQQGVETPPGRGWGGQQAAPPPVPSPAPGIRGLSRHCGASRALCDHVAALRETTAKDKICSVLSPVSSRRFPNLAVRV